jgi:FemAB-related protein (PEP-CTERM system-associated)
MTAAGPAACAAVDVQEIGASDFAEWDAWVDGSEEATFCHRTGWKTIVEKVLGRRCYFYAARRAGKIVGVFPIAHVRSPLFGDSLVSLPLAVYGGIAAADREAFDALLAAGSRLAERLGVGFLEMRNRTEPFPTSLPGRDLYVTFSQDLTPGPEKLLTALPRDTRYAVRKSIKAGLEWTEDLSIDEFYEIYAQSVHRLGTPVFSKSLFYTARQAFPGQTRLFGVKKDGKPIAGVFCFTSAGRMMPYYGGSLAEYNRDAPNNFMYWKLIERSCTEGFRIFDFGRSKRGTGAFSFKSSWSMTMSDLPYRYQLIRAKEVPKMSPVDAKFELPVAIWKRMPFAATKVIGPALIRHIPSV